MECFNSVTMTEEGYIWFDRRLSTKINECDKKVHRYFRTLSTANKRQLNKEKHFDKLGLKVLKTVRYDLHQFLTNSGLHTFRGREHSITIFQQKSFFKQHRSIGIHMVFRGSITRLCQSFRG